MTTLKRIRQAQKDRAAHVARTTMSRIGVGGFTFWDRPGATRQKIAHQIAQQFCGRVVYEEVQSGCEYHQEPSWIEVPLANFDPASAAYSTALAAAGLE